MRITRRQKLCKVLPLCAWIAPFVQIDVIEKCLDIGAIAEMAFVKPALKRRGSFVVPAPFPHKLVPNLHFLRAWTASLLKAPLQNLLVRASLCNSLGKRRVLDPKKCAASAVKSNTEIWLIFVRQLRGLVQPDFVDHAREVDDSAELFVGASQVLNFHAAGR